MSWLDDLFADFDRAPDPAPTVTKRNAPVTVTRPFPAAPRQAKPAEIKSLWVQTRTPSDATDTGACEAAFYSIAAGVLTMTDEDGKPTGQEHRLAPGDDERKIAGRLARKARERADPENFNRPLGYARTGVA